MQTRWGGTRSRCAAAWRLCSPGCCSLCSWRCRVVRPDRGGWLPWGSRPRCRRPACWLPGWRSGPRSPQRSSPPADRLTVRRTPDDKLRRVTDPVAPTPEPARLVVLISGSGSNLQALLDAAADPAYGAKVVAVGADRAAIAGLDRAAAAGVPTFVDSVKAYPTRDDWDAGLTAHVAEHKPDLVISAGFLKLVGGRFLAAFGDRYLNTHNALLPSFPGMHGPRDALAYGVKIAGATLFFVNASVNTGPIVAQVAVPVRDD